MSDKTYELTMKISDKIHDSFIKYYKGITRESSLTVSERLFFESIQDFVCNDTYTEIKKSLDYLEDINEL